MAARTRTTSAQRAAGAPDKVHFNLDTIEREGEEREPFTAILGGKAIVFADPMEMDYQDLMEVDNPARFADVAIEDDEAREHFLSLRIKAWQLNELMDAFQSHYGLGSRGNARA